jgi:hypothetical protein
MISISERDFTAFLPYTSNPGQGPGPQSRMPGGSPTMNKHRPLRASGSIGLKHMEHWDVAIGTMRT